MPYFRFIDSFHNIKQIYNIINSLYGDILIFTGLIIQKSDIYNHIYYDIEFQFRCNEDRIKFHKKTIRQIIPVSDEEEIYIYLLSPHSRL